MRLARAAAVLAVVGLLLAPTAVAALPAARAGTLHLVVRADGTAQWSLLPSAPHAQDVSECSATAPVSFTCQGSPINITDTLAFSIAFDVEALSTDVIHISEVVNKTAVFAYNCQAPHVVWLADLVFDDFDCGTFGKAAFHTAASVRLDIPYLPQEGIVSLGGWDAQLAPA